MRKQANCWQILDIRPCHFRHHGVQGFDLLQKASGSPIPRAGGNATAHALSPESLKKSIELGARAYLPKDRLGGGGTLPGRRHDLRIRGHWETRLKQLEGASNKAWGPYWRKPDEKFWNEFEEKIASQMSEKTNSQFHYGN